MEKIFPEPTPYEVINNSYVPSFAFNLVYELDKEIKKLKLKKTNKCKIVIFDKIYILFFLVIILKIGLHYK